MASLFARRLPLLRTPLRTIRTNNPTIPTTARTFTFFSHPLRTKSTNPLTASLYAGRKPQFFTSLRPSRPSSSLSNLADSLPSQAGKAAQPLPRFPETSSNAVAYWLLGSAALVFGIVVLGGLTRLTQSGLSITEWRPITGVLPPMSAEEWDAEFEKYKSSPEYIKLNNRMTFEEFKFIYYMEWAHRIWGRVIGLAFVFPAAYFIARRQVSAPMARRLGIIGALIGFQGALGWWMVKSGLDHEAFERPGSVPRVSQYRLTAHLGAAFVLYAAMLHNGLAILRENRLLKDPASVQSYIARLRSLGSVRYSIGILGALIFITAMSGGLVAGLDAGLIYNEFPTMGLGLTPPKSELMDPFYCRREDKSDLWWRNHLENPSMVQLQHRILAVSTFTLICLFVALSRFHPRLSAALTKKEKSGITGMMHVGLLQVGLGISTLLLMVPTHLAATHQAGSLALLSMALVAGGRVWVPRRVGEIAAKRLLAGQGKALGKGV